MYRESLNKRVPWLGRRRPSVLVGYAVTMGLATLVGSRTLWSGKVGQRRLISRHVWRMSEFEHNVLCSSGFLVNESGYGDRHAGVSGNL